MKILKYKVAGKLYQQETGPEAQVGDQVKMFLDTEANPELPASIFGIIQPGIQRTGCCDEYTIYPIEYDETDLGSGFLHPDDVLNVETTAAVDVVAADLQEEVERATAAEGVLTTNLAAEVAARTAADNLLAPKASPTFTGDPKAPTPTVNDNDTSIATTAFVQSQPTVRYTPQALNSGQQDQAQANIGIENINFGVRALLGTGGFDALNWEFRQLIDETGNNILTWTSSTGLTLGTTTAQKVGFHGVAPVAQRTGASQAAVVTTASTQTSPWGFATQAQADGVITLLNEIRAALVQNGLIKGSA